MGYDTCVIDLDLGTTNCKALALDAEGKQLGLQRLPPVFTALRLGLAASR